MQRDIDFFSVYRSPIDQDSGLDKATVVGLILVCVCLVGVLGGYAGLKVRENSFSASISSATAYLGRSDVTAAAAKVAKDSQKLSVLNAYAKTAGAETAAFSALPKPDSAALGQIAKSMPADVSVTRISYQLGIYTLTCKASSGLSAANFAHTLRASGFIAATYSDVNKVSPTEYDFTVTATVKGGAAK